MTSLLVLSDCGTPSGYGRIADEVLLRLFKRGVQIHAASLGFDGLLPPRIGSTLLPYWVAPTPNPGFVERFAAILGALKPDVVMVIQDAPYIEAIRNLPYDWSTTGFIGITPVDGVPIYPRWISVAKQADAWLCISEYGVKAYAASGVETTLCRPGIDPSAFWKKPEAERLVIRQKLGLSADHFIVGTMAQNQGRKAISSMLAAFFEFAKDKPHARYLLDMEAVSPAGWDIPSLCEQYRWDRNLLLYRHDAQKAGLHDLNDRYNLLDVHMVISHREGFGLPLAEAMACGVPGLALDYCSGPEIIGADERGILVPSISYSEPGTWGGAEDRFPDIAALIAALQALYDSPAKRLLLGDAGRRWAADLTWDKAADIVFEAVNRVAVVVQKRKESMVRV